MKFGKLTIENFMSIGQAEIDLSDCGLVLIMGENRDESSAQSNGAGKSGLVDSLCWCLNDETARGASGDIIVNRTAGKGTRVSVEIQDGDDVFEVARHRKHPVKKNRLIFRQLAPVQVDLTGGTDKITQEAVWKFLGCSPQVFVSSIYAGQEIFPNLPALTDKALKVLVEEAAGIERLESAYTIAKDRQAKAKDRNNQSQSTLDRLLVAHADVTQTIAGLDVQAEEWEKQRLDRIKAAQGSAGDALLKANEEDGQVDQLILSQLDVALNSINGQLQNFNALQAQERDLLAAKMRADANLEDEKRRQKLAADDIVAIKRGIEKLDQRIGAPCNECGKLYRPEDMEVAKQAQLKKLSVIEGVYEGFHQVIEDASEAAQKAAQALEAYRATLPDVSKLNGLQRDLLARKAIIQQHAKAAEEWRAQARRLLDQADAITKEVNPLILSREQLQARLQTITAEIDKAKIEVENTNKAALLASKVVDVFSPKGVRAQILDTVTPYLNDRTATYLTGLSDGNIQAVWSTLTTNAKGELREKFEIQVTSKTGGDAFKLLSGGEKRKVRLATAMALQDLVASRATKPIELFVADEIDSALDDAGLERLLVVLEEKARDKGTVLVISHHPLSAIRQVMTVVKENGVSTIV